MYGTVALKYFNVINGITAGDITLDATTGNATVTNLAVTAETSLGNVANVSITGGSAGQVLTTDGTGNLNFTTPGAATTGNIYVYTRSASIVKIPIQLGSIVIMGRTGNILIPIQA
jgi:hypothetical protein